MEKGWWDIKKDECKLFNLTRTYPELSLSIDEYQYRWDVELRLLPGPEERAELND